MPTLRQLSRDFSAQTRQRGEEYFRQGRVSLVHATDQSAYARVRGSTTYVVEVQWDDEGIVDAACTCPYFEDHLEPCKHIWATLLEAESVGHLAGGGGGGGSNRGPTKSAAPPTPEWKRQLERVRYRMEEDARAGYVEKPVLTWPPDRQINYILDVPATLLEGTSNLVIELATQRLKDGHWDRPKQSKFSWDEWMSVPDETDRQALQMLLGARDSWEYAYRAERQFVLPAGPAGETVLRTMCRTGRCKVRTRPDDKDPKPVDFDDGPPWEFRLRVAPNDAGQMTLTGRLARDDQSMDITEPAVVLRGGLMIARGRVARLNHAGAFDLLAMLREGRHIDVPKNEAGALIEELYRLPRPPAMELPDELRIDELRPPIQPVLKVKATAENAERLSAELTYEYAGRSVIPGEKGAAIFDTGERRVIRRDPHAEANAWQRLMQAGFKLDWDYVARRQGLMVPAAKFAKAVRGLVAEGWRVEAEGKLWRSPSGAPSVTVTSGIDWFELEAKVDFGGTTASLPRLLAALRKGDETILLDDGTMGVVPEEWLRKYAPLAGFGQEHDGKIRFAATQVGFLDALLANTPDATWDDAFDKARRRLADFTGIRPADAPKTFTGQLRPYQKDALGWLAFLREFGFGGCLADDMGLGKTVVVLAMLAGRKGNGPSLVVAPRSLVFNWAQEAKRFAPKLRVLDHTPAGRTRATEAVAGHDLVLTTYGTLRRDAGYLKDVRFDYVVLDESQAIKNASTASAKACKLLKADHRLALSGTPIENHLGELWSLLDFLNPGMLGTSAAFRHWTGGASAPADDAARRTLAAAIRPFVLRRTKKQVAKDLPERTEQTIWCELDAPQRKLYDELRDHYRASLLERVKKEGINKAKIQILEALLRLRQAACHPGLIDPKRAADSSAKFEALFADLDELMDEGHKVLVFSQFTSLLALVKNHLDARKLPYEYLDGKTKDRQARVERFQNDPAIKLFLISLKAGGVGLNLTAADYVFLLDPWWNPAAEAQAVDRAHRIGQTRNVFAYRLIAKDTVEEKVLELQQTKRDLADAIITADNALIAKLGREDLERLLS